MNRREWTQRRNTGLLPPRRRTVKRVRLELPLFNINNDVPVACGEDARSVSLVLFTEDDGRRTLHAPAFGCRVADLDPGDIDWLDALATLATSNPTGGGVTMSADFVRSTEGRLQILLGAHSEVGNLLSVEV